VQVLHSLFAGIALLIGSVFGLFVHSAPSQPAAVADATNAPVAVVETQTTTPSAPNPTTIAGSAPTQGGGGAISNGVTDSQLEAKLAALHHQIKSESVSSDVVDKLQKQIDALNTTRSGGAAVSPQIAAGGNPDNPYAGLSRIFNLPSGVTVGGNTPVATQADIPDVSSFLQKTGGDSAGTTTFSSLLPTSAGTLSQTVTTTIATATNAYYQDNQKPMAIGLDGFARIVYVQADSYTDVHYVQCLNDNCSQKNDTVVATDSNGVDQPVIKIGSDGYARIVYVTYATTRVLHYIVCQNDDCSLKTDSVIDNSNPRAFYEVGLVLGTDDKARILYNDYGDNTMRLALCADATCTSTSTTMMPMSYGSAFGFATGPDGYLRIAYYDNLTTRTVYFLQCQNDNCSQRASTTIATVSAGNNAYEFDLAMGSDGFARFGYTSPDGHFFVMCTNIDCSAKTVTKIDPQSSGVISIVMGDDDLPRIFYTYGNPSYEVYLQCTNATCSTSVGSNLALSAGYTVSIAIGNDGFPRLLYTPNAGKTLAFARLLNDSGLPTGAGAGLGSLSSPFGQTYTTSLDTQYLSITGSAAITHGYLGIGTTHPITPLEIDGTNNGAFMILQGTNPTDSNQINMYNDAGVGAFLGMEGSQSTFRPNSVTFWTNGLHLYADNSTGDGTITFEPFIHGAYSDANPKVTFFPNGNVAIGNPTASSRLTIFGPDTSGATPVLIIANQASTTEFSVFDDGNATLAGTLTQNSDQRLKTNITPLDASSSLAAIGALVPVNFNWADTSLSSTTQVGFIAQAVARVFPNLVSTTSPTALTPDGTLGINYIGLVAPIISAIQGLVAQVADLSRKVADMAQNIVSEHVTAVVGEFAQLCADKSDGSKVCVSGDQLANILTGAGGSTTSAPTPPDNATTTDATSTPDTPTMSDQTSTTTQQSASSSDPGVLSGDTATTTDATSTMP